MMAYTNQNPQRGGPPKTPIMRAIKMISRTAAPPFQPPRGTRWTPHQVVRCRRKEDVLHILHIPGLLHGKGLERPGYGTSGTDRAGTSPINAGVYFTN